MTLINQEPVLAGSSTEAFTTVTVFTGDSPVVTTPEVVADAVIASVDLPALSVVGRDSSGKLVLADISNATEANRIHPIGITTAAVKTGSTVKSVAVYRGGTFNPAALNFHSSYDTAEKKRLAFEKLAPMIFIKPVG